MKLDITTIALIGVGLVAAYWLYTGGLGRIGRTPQEFDPNKASAGNKYNS